MNSHRPIENPLRVLGSDGLVTFPHRHSPGNYLDNLARPKVEHHETLELTTEPGQTSQSRVRFFVPEDLENIRLMLSSGDVNALYDLGS